MVAPASPQTVDVRLRWTMRQEPKKKSCDKQLILPRANHFGRTLRTLLGTGRSVLLALLSLGAVDNYEGGSS